MYQMNESEERQLEAFAEKMGLRTHFMASAVAVRTKRGSWHIIPADANCWKLNHENTNYPTCHDQRISKQFHKQKRNFPNFQDALRYIAAHDSLDRPIYWR